MKYWQPDDHANALAAKQGRADELLDLRMLHQWVHGSTFVIGQRWAKAAEGTVEIGGRAVEHADWAEAAAMSAAQSALHATRSFCQIIGLAEPAELASLLEEIDVLAKASAAATD